MGYQPGRRSISTRGGTIYREKEGKMNPKEIIQEKVNKFKREINYQLNLDVSDSYSPYEKHEDLKKGEHPFPNSGSPGVYVFWPNNNDRPLYIGKSSDAIGNRVWAHLGRWGPSSDPYPDAEKWLKEKLRDVLLYTIPFPKEHRYLSSALEEFLIKELGPLQNRVLK